MKLHLPKSLFAAVMVACTMSTTAWAVGEWSGAPDADNIPLGSVYYVKDTVDASVTAPDNFTTLYLAQAHVGDNQTGDYAATITTMQLKDGDTLIVRDHPWRDDNSTNFKALTIGTLQIGDGTGSANFTVKAHQEVNLNDVDGSLASVTNEGKLTISDAVPASDDESASHFDLITNSGDMTITGGSVGHITTTGGTIDITAATLSIGAGAANEKYSNNHKPGIYAKGGSTINIGDGTNTSVVTLTRLEMSDSRTGNDSTLNVKDNATLIITGDDTYANTWNPHYDVGIMLGEWDDDSELNVEGEFYAKDATVYSGTAKGIINVKNGATMAVKGFKSFQNKASSAIDITVEENGTLILGSTGIAYTHNVNGCTPVSVTLDASTIGISADATISAGITLKNSTTGTKFDTTLYTWDTETDVATKGTTGGTLTISGVIADAESASGKLVKEGAGTLFLSGANTYSGGTIIEDGTIIADNDKAMGGAGVTINTGTLQVGVGEADSKDVNLTITGGLSLTQKSDANKVALSEGSSLTLGDIKFTGSKNDGSIVRVADGADTEAYSAGNASYSVSNATVTVSGSTDVSISNRLIDVALVNNSTGKVTATNGYNNLTAIEAVNGNIHVQGQQGKQGQTYHDLSALTVGAGKTVGIHTVWKGNITDIENQATVTVAGTATFGEGANLYAGLTLADGASLTLDGALTMHGGILTLGSNITLDSTTLTSITSLADGDTTVTLFTGVGSLTLSGPALLSETGQYTLNQIFAGEGLENFYLSYKDGEVYAGKVVVAPTPGIPEPATATLSLLALCGLAARRRRK